jgi:hypothetical protein
MSDRRRLTIRVGSARSAVPPIRVASTVSTSRNYVTREPGYPASSIVTDDFLAQPFHPSLHVRTSTGGRPPTTTAPAYSNENGHGIFRCFVSRSCRTRSTTLPALLEHANTYHHIMERGWVHLPLPPPLTRIALCVRCMNFFDLSLNAQHMCREDDRDPTLCYWAHLNEPPDHLSEPDEAPDAYRASDE